MTVDLEAIFKSADKKLTKDEKKNIMDELITEVKQQFMYMLKNDDGRYCFTLKQALTWIGNPPDNYNNAKKMFKRRYLMITGGGDPADSVFDRADGEKDKFKDYIIRREGRSDEIYFSVTGFQTFCMSQNKGIRAKAVKKYFIVLQSEYMKALRASEAENRSKLEALEKKFAEMDKEKGGEKMSTYMTKKIESRITKLRERNEKLETDNRRKDEKIRDLHASAVIHNSGYDPDHGDYEEFVHKSVSDIYRKKFLTQKNVYLIRPSKLEQLIGKSLQKKKLQKDMDYFDSDDEDNDETRDAEIKKLRDSGMSTKSIKKNFPHLFENEGPRVRIENNDDRKFKLNSTKDDEFDLTDTIDPEETHYLAIQSMGSKTNLEQSDITSIRKWEDKIMKNPLDAIKKNWDAKKPKLNHKVVGTVGFVDKDHHAKFLEKLGEPVYTNARGTLQVYQTTLSAMHHFADDVIWRTATSQKR